MTTPSSETKTKVSVSIIGDAFADIFCYLENGLPPLGGDIRVGKPSKFWNARGKILRRFVMVSSILFLHFGLIQYSYLISLLSQCHLFLEGPGLTQQPI